ncbi:NAD(P)/FAD-dependent oxidoreductase [Limibacillus halophilus]
MTAAQHTDSYYAASANPSPERPPLQGRMNADVCIVGGGFTGVSAALNLAEKGYSVVLLEAERIGWGASGRNGGHIGTGFASGQHKIESWVGKEDARKLWDFCEEAKGIIRERAARHAISCDLKWGYLHAAPKQRHLEELREEQEHWASYGYAEGVRLIGKDELPQHCNSPTYVGGLLDQGAGHLHPLNYCLGLAVAAEEAGAKLHDGNRVTAIEQGPKVKVTTSAGGEVEASFLLLACNAYLGDLMPPIRGKVMPVGTYIGATRPLPEELAKSLIPNDIAVADSYFVLNYFQLSGDRRMLFGGGVSYTTMMPPNLPGHMKAKMTHILPQLKGQDFEFVWGGFVGITVERTPHLGRLGQHGNIFFAQGFSGQGVALTGMAGKVMAEAVAGTAERFDLFAKLPHQTFPGGRLLRAPSLALAMLWFRMKDLLP